MKPSAEGDFHLSCSGTDSVRKCVLLGGPVIRSFGFDGGVDGVLISGNFSSDCVVEIPVLGLSRAYSHKITEKIKAV